jgi:hypothetical protein
MSKHYPAFPVSSEFASMNNKDSTHTPLIGMTLRDYFAAKAMQVMIANDETTFEEDAESAYAIADKMLAQREK